MNLMFQPLRKYAVFEGRARRSEYWQFVAFLSGVAFVALVAVAVVSDGLQTIDAEASSSPLVDALIGLLGLAYLAILIPLLAVTVRRLHDTNRSGWWVFIRIVPIVGGLVLFVFTVLEGSKGRNSYGADPKGDGETADEKTAEVFA